MPRRSYLAWLAFLLAASSLSLQPLLAGHIPWQGDGLLHLYRLPALEFSLNPAVLSGWFPRWLPVLGTGYGFPLFNYYPPLATYLLLPLRWAGLSVPGAAAAGYALAFLLLAGSISGWAGSMWGRRAGMAAAVLAALSPYLLANLYQRAALAELWGLAWLAAAGWAAWALAAGRRAAWLPLVFSLAALLLSHNITALIGLPLVLGVWALRAGGRGTGNGERGMVGWMVSAVGMGLGLSAFFWVPALLEQAYVQIDRLVGSSNFAFANHFLTVGELVALPGAVDPALINPGLPLGPGWPALALALSGMMRRPRAAHGRGLWWGLLLGTVACLWMTTASSTFLWETLPLLPFVQFPWRFLGPAAIGLALLGGYGVDGLLDRLAASGRPGALPLASGIGWLALAVTALPYLFPPAAPALPDNPTPADLILFEVESGWLGTTSAADYLPRAVAELPPPRPSADPAFMAGGPPFEVAVAAAGSRTFPQFYFPGWRAEVDGRPAAVYPSGPSGLIAVDLPAGSHQVQFAFGPTPLRRLAGFVSGVSWVALLLGLLWLKIRPGVRPKKREESPGAAGRTASISAAAWLLLAIGLLLVKGALLDRVDSPVRQSRFDGQSVRGTEPANLNFGGRLLLVGLERPAGPHPADQPLELALYWQGKQFDRELSVGVHLLDGDGLRYGQSDHLHPGDFPLPRWRPEQYARDPHAIRLSPGTPPGGYRLELFVYDPVDGRRVDLWNDVGQPIGSRAEIGRVVIGLPERFPDPAVLRPAERLDREIAPGITLLGIDGSATPLQVGETLSLTLYWAVTGRPAAPLDEDLLLVGGGGVAAAFPLSPNAPGPDWEAGRAQRDDYRLRLPAGLAAGRYRLELAGLTLAEVEVVVPARRLDPPAAGLSLDQPVGEAAVLRGADITLCAEPAGLPCGVVLVWEAAAESDTSYTVFVQLLGPDGRIVAQHDGLPVNDGELRPTTGWLPGEFLVDVHPLSPPDSPPTGAYRLIAGLYRADTGERLPAGEADFVLIGQYTVP